MLSAASGDRWEALYVVALHTGLRRGEALGLLWEDVKLEEATLSVKRSLDVDGTLKTPKNPASRRTLKLAPRALAALKAHKVRQNEERLRRLMCNELYEQVRQVAQRSAEGVVNPLSASVCRDLGRQARQQPSQRLGTVVLSAYIHSLRSSLPTRRKCCGRQ